MTPEVLHTPEGPHVGRQLLAAMRLDLGEIVRSRWMWLCSALYALLGATFVLVGMRESMVYGFSGMGRVLLSMVHTLLLLLPLLALTATGQLINRARSDGTMELVFTLPISREVYFVACSLTRYLVLTVPLVSLMLLMALVGRAVFGQDVGWAFLGQTMLISASLVLAFVGVGIAVSTRVRSETRALIWLLALWASAVVVLDFGLVGLMLQWRLNPQTVFLLASANPVQAARMALLSGASQELSVLGPVGLYLSTRIGAAGLLTLGVVWPAVVGLGSWAWALSSFRRTDLV